VRAELLAAMGRRMIPHRGPEMLALLARVHPRLQALAGTARPVYIASSAATGMMEAAVRCASRKRVLSLVSGAFGERFARIAESCGREVTRVTVPPGDVVTVEQLALALEHGHYDAVTAVHVETSTGTLNDIAAFAAVTRERPDTMLLVDAVSSVGGMRVRMDEWGADVLFFASQKALALPPGLAFAAMSERAMDRAVVLPDRGMYLDLVRYDEFWQRGQTLGTPAVSVLFALDEQLAAIETEGAGARFARHEAMRAAVENWVQHARSRDLPVGMLAAEGARAPTVSCLTYGGDTGALLARLEERGFVIGSGYGALGAGTVRIGHMGDHTVLETEKLLAAMEEVMIHLH
jgi:aspartate aminotransferase-like enzyme